MSTLANSEPALTLLIACCGKATILLACAWIMVIALRRGSAALRHHVWAAAILASLALPFLVLLLPAWHAATLGSAALYGALRMETQQAPALTQFLPSLLTP
jgi:hypothetical protein